MIVVADAGPLLHLHWIGAQEWALPPCAITVVDEVWQEVEHHAPRALNDKRLKREASTSAHTDALSSWRLDRGELAALEYALGQSGEVLVLCDELEARAACRALSLAVTGSIGLVVEAARAGRVGTAAAIEALRDLPKSGRLHVDARLIEDVVRQMM